jgi:lipopolysaccharide transport system ATP-binding protein
MTAALELTGVSKRYWQLRDQAMLIKSVLPGRRPERLEHWAVRDVSFKIEPGETVGVLGRNGAGKTTLLRMLAGVSRPTEGQIRISGRVAPLIGVGVGFHPEMSGRENIFVNGMLLGLTQKQVQNRLEQIVDFAEIDNFIDTPVKFYSSGMYMRLGFSVAASVDPDIMLVDEVLAVGDVAFQLKCFDRMRELQTNGTTVLLVSHSMHAIRLLCPRALLFRKGRLELDGTSEEAIARHHELMSTESEEIDGAAAATVEDVYLVGPKGRTHHPDAGDSVEYFATVRFRRPVDSPTLLLQIYNETGVLAYSMCTKLGQTWRQFDEGDTFEVRIPFQAALGGGSYRLCIYVFDRDGRDSLGQDSPGLLMYVAPRIGAGGLADLQASIEIDNEPMSDFDSLLLSPRRGAADAAS